MIQYLNYDPFVLVDMKNARYLANVGIPGVVDKHVRMGKFTVDNRQFDLEIYQHMNEVHVIQQFDDDVVVDSFGFLVKNEYVDKIYHCNHQNMQSEGGLIYTKQYLDFCRELLIPYNPKLQTEENKILLKLSW